MGSARLCPPNPSRITAKASSNTTDGRHQPGIPDVIHYVDSYPRYSDFVHNGHFESEKTSNDPIKAHDEIEKLQEDLKDANTWNSAITTNERDGTAEKAAYK